MKVFPRPSLHRRPLILGKGGFGRQLADWLLTTAGVRPFFWTTTPPAAPARCMTTPTPPCCIPAAPPLWRWVTMNCG